MFPKGFWCQDGAQDEAVYGRSIAPRGSFRSDCQVKAILYGKTDKANGAFAPYQGRNSYRHDMPDNERRDCRLIVGAKEESSIAFVDDSGFVKMESRLVVNGNPPEFFDLMAEVLAVEEINHPLHAHKTALQQEELTPLFVVQLHNVKGRSCGSVISESDG